MSQYNAIPECDSPFVYDSPETMQFLKRTIWNYIEFHNF